MTTLIMLVASLLYVPQGARDRATTPPAGTARISGVVVAAGESPQPIRRAIVTIAGTGIATPRQVLTDDEGKFAFVGLAAGRFSLTADKPAYLKTHYGNRTPGRAPGMPIAVTAGQLLDTIRIPLVRGAAIGGRVIDEAGAPLGSSQVSLSYVTYVNGARKLIAPPSGAPWVVTDDRGVYRAYGLTPGEYVVRAASGGGGFSGTTQLMTPELWAAAMSRTPGATPTVPRPLVRLTTYYPSAVNEAQAQVITLAAGDDRNDIDITRVFGTTTVVRATGTAVGPDGQPATNISVGIANMTTMTLWGSPGLVRTSPDGTFTAPPLSPGRYMFFGGGSDNPNSGFRNFPWWTETEFVLGEQDLTGLVIRFERGATVNGQLVFRGTSPPPELSRLVVSLRPVADIPEAAPFAQPATPRPDGTFTITNVPAGKYRVNISATGGAWTLLSATMSGRDTLDQPLEVLSGQQVAALTVTMTDRPSEITGVLFDQLNRRAPEYSVVVISADRAMWTTSPRRNSGVVKLGSDGSYRVTGLPAGEYLLCVLTDVEPRQLNDPSFLEQLAPTAVRITLGDGEKKQQNLKIGG